MSNWDKEKARHDERKAQGLCVQCCAPMDEPLKYVYCKACREKRNEYQRKYREEHPRPKLTLKEQAMKKRAMKKLPLKEQAIGTARDKEMRAAAMQMIEDAKINRKAKKCLKCEWASITGTKVMCLFPEGSCMKQ